MKKLVVVLPSDVVAKTLYGSGALNELNLKYSIHYLLAPEVTEDLRGQATRIPLGYKASRLFCRLDFVFWYAELFYFLKMRGEDLRESYKYQNLSPFWRSVCDMFATSWAMVAIRWLDRKVFARDSAVEAFLQQFRPDLVIMPGSALDSYSFLVGRSAKKIGIRTLSIVTHWDHFSKKNLFRFVPDKVCLWGADMLESANRFGEHDPNIFSVVGAPQFQKYLSERRNRRAAAHALGLDESKKWLLYAAPSVPFDDLSLLVRINQFIESKQLKDVAVIYRPHPRAHPRKSRSHAYLKDLQHVVVDSNNAAGKDLDEHYLNLLAITSALITPWSTMVLEYSLLGLPALCISFSDGINQWDWTNTERSEHVVAVLSRNAVLSCKCEAEFESSLLELLGKIDDEEYRQHIMQSTKNAVFTDEKTYAERLCQYIETDFKN